MSNTPPEIEVELSEEEFELDQTAEDVEITEVQTRDNADVETQDPEARALGSAAAGTERGDDDA